MKPSREAYHQGKVADAALREAALRGQRLIDRVGAFDDPEIAPDGPTTGRRSSPSSGRGSPRRVWCCSKNKGALPLSPKACADPRGDRAEREDRRRSWVVAAARRSIRILRRALRRSARGAAHAFSPRRCEVRADNRRLAGALRRRGRRSTYLRWPLNSRLAVHNARSRKGSSCSSVSKRPEASRPDDFSARMRSPVTWPQATGEVDLGLGGPSGPARLLIDGECRHRRMGLQARQGIFQ